MRVIKIILSLLVLVGIGVGGWYYWQWTQTQPSSEVSTELTSQLAPSQVTLQPIPNPSYSVTQQSVTFMSNGNRLVGELYLPQSDQQVPLAVYAHELGMNRDAGRPYAEFLAQRGVATIIFDFAGGSPSSESDGNPDEMTISSEVADLEAVITQAQELPGVDASQVHVIGGSQGGLVAALAAAQHPQLVRSLTLLYPAFLIPEVIRQLAQVAGNRNAVTSLFGVYPIGPAYVSDVWDMDVYSTIGRYTGPVMILQGSQDPLIDVSYAQQAISIYPNAQLHVIEGAGHSFTDEHFEEASQYIWSAITATR